MSWNATKLISPEALADRLGCPVYTARVVLRLVDGEPVSSVIKTLKITRNNLDSRLHRLYRELGVTNRTQMAYVVGREAEAERRRRIGGS